MGSRHQKPPSRSLQSVPSSSDQPPTDIPEWFEHVRASVEENTPLMRTLIMRSINAVMRFEELSEDSIVNATIAPTDLGVLVRALASGELIEDLRSFEPLAPAFLRGIQARNQLLNENGGTLTAEEVAGVLGISRQAVEKRRSSGNLLGLTTGRHGYRYPSWQFTKLGVIPGLQDVLRALAPYDPWMQAAFFLGINPRLKDKSPLEMLKAGQLSIVLEAAEAYGEHGAA
jgi:hypothetical protein